MSESGSDVKGQFDKLVEEAPLAVVSVDRAARVRIWNRAASALFGWSMAEVLGIPLPITLEDERGTAEPAGPILLCGARQIGREIRCRRKDGASLDLNLWTMPLLNASNAVGGGVGFFADITQKKRSEQRLAERTWQLQTVRLVAGEITRELHLPTLLQVIIRRAAELVGADSGEVWLWDAAEDALILKAWHGSEDRRVFRLALGQGVAGQAAKLRQGLLVNDCAQSPDALLGSCARSEIGRALAEPLLCHERLLGVIRLGNPLDAAPFAEHHRGLLHLFVDHAAIAIENARLYDAVQQELTDRSHVEETVRRHHLLAQHARDIVLFVERKSGRILEANAAATLAYGYSAEELLLRTLRELCSEEPVIPADGQAVEGAHRRKDGSTFPVEIRMWASAGSDAGQLLCIVRDLTEPRELVAVLEREREHLATAFRVCPDAMAIETLVDGRYLEVNERFLRLMGYTRDEIIGRTARELGTWADCAGRDDLTHAIKTCGVVHDRAVALRTKPGKHLAALLSADTLCLEGAMCLLTVIHGTRSG